MASYTADNEFSKDDLWKNLALLAQNGDKEAYSELLRDIIPFVKASLSGTLANPDWIEDISQEVLISVHKSLHSYSNDRPFKPWLNAIIKFRRTDFLRKHYKSRKTKEATQDSIEIFEQNVTFQDTSGELKDIEDAISALPEKQQKIFKMMKIEGYSAKEVANEMDMSVSAVKVAAHRTTNKLKDMLG